MNQNVVDPHDFFFISGLFVYVFLFRTSIRFVLTLKINVLFAFILLRFSFFFRLASLTLSNRGGQRQVLYERI